VVLSDLNVDLIGCYQAVRDRTEQVITALRTLQEEHRQHGDECYYDVRDRRFNPRRAKLLADPDRAAAHEYSAELAAMLIFLNRTGFNGLFRLNRRGDFNVPAGRYHEPRICDPDHIRAVADVLRRPGLTLIHRSFDVTLGDAAAGDFVYCDPPYAPLSRTSSFANYTAAGFNALDQQRLMDAVIRACRRGAHVVVSNSSASEIESACRTRAALRAKIAVHRVPARRAINSKASSRGPVDELIITNVADPRSAAVARLRGTRPAMLKVGLETPAGRTTGVANRVPQKSEPSRRTRRSA
jgi:DNA adenine methylase